MRIFKMPKLKYWVASIIKSGSLMLLLLCPTLSRAEEAKLFPFPLVEAEKAISDWLRNRGFQVSSSPAESSLIQIKAIKNKEKWEVFCQSYSPLASLIKVQLEKAHPVDQKDLQEFWLFLENYGRGAYTDSRKQTTYPQSIFSILSAAVVCIEGHTGEVPLQFSGFLINEKGTIISTAHDLEKIKGLKIILKNKNELPGSLIRKDGQRDLSLIKVNGQFKNYILWQEGRKTLLLGEKVYMLSCANRDAGEFIAGVVEEALQQKNKLPLWRVDMETLPGSSGGPVFDRYGNLIGIVKGRLKGTDHVGFLIPLTTLYEFLKESSFK